MLLETIVQIIAPARPSFHKYKLNNNEEGEIDKPLIQGNVYMLIKSGLC